MKKLLYTVLLLAGLPICAVDILEIENQLGEDLRGQFYYKTIGTGSLIETGKLFTIDKNSAHQYAMPDTKLLKTRVLSIQEKTGNGSASAYIGVGVLSGQKVKKAIIRGKANNTFDIALS